MNAHDIVPARAHRTEWLFLVQARPTTGAGSTAGRCYGNRWIALVMLIAMQCAFNPCRAQMAFTDTSLVDLGVPNILEQANAQAATPAPPGSPRLSTSTAPTFLIQPSISSQFTSTTNATLQPGHHADQILMVSPALTLHDRTANFTLDGQFALDGTWYGNRTAPDSVLPRGSLDLNANLHDGLIFLNSNLSSTQSAANPFIGQNAGNSTNNSLSTTQFRLSPYLISEIAPDVRLLARSDNIFITNSARDGNIDTSNGRISDQFIRFEGDMAPIRWGSELRYMSSKYDIAAEPALRDRSVRFSTSYLVEDSQRIGLIIGTENVDIQGTHVNHGIAGVTYEWHPSPRTNLNLRLERRYFGTGWDVLLSTRGRREIFSVSWARSPTTYQAEIVSAGQGSLLGLLTQLLTPRISDSAARSDAANAILRNSGFSQTLPGSQIAFTPQALLVESASASAYFFNRLDGLNLTAYRSRTRPLQESSEAFVQLPSTGRAIEFEADAANNLQYGASIALSHVITPGLIINGSLSRAETFGLGSNSGSVIRQSVAVLRLTHRLSIKTSVFIGLRKQWIDFGPLPSADESAVYVGFNTAF